ncbi:MAG: ATP-dependent protease [Actinobacteria bacterium]|nr:ATP-dependent protease [Actinomycetota bacterium]
MADPTPMFPLGTVLFPHAVLPLHVFEPRYREMVQHCIAGDREFGVVLIERGHEVGGGDIRFDVGTATRIVQAGELEDGRWVLMNVGVERLRVVEWLPDDPYPQARVERLRDDAGSAVDGQAAGVEGLLRRALAMRAELGDPTAPLEFTLSDDPVQASFEAAATAPIGPLDAQRLLEIDTAAERLTLLEELLTEECAVLELRLSGQ